MPVRMDDVDAGVYVRVLCARIYVCDQWNLWIFNLICAMEHRLQNIM